MKWSTVPKKKFRVIQRFLWFPETKMRDEDDVPESRWLCWARIEQRWENDEWTECRWWID